MATDLFTRTPARCININPGVSLTQREIHQPCVCRWWHASTRGPIFKRIFKLVPGAPEDWSSVIKWWRGVFHEEGIEVGSLTSLELELEWALECPDTSRVYFTKCSWPEREKSGERGGKKWKRWGKVKRIRVSFAYGNGYRRGWHESNQEKGVVDADRPQRAMGSTAIFTCCEIYRKWDAKDLIILDRYSWKIVWCIFIW